MAIAALGFRPHSGWTALVAIAGDPVRPEVLFRGRLELAEKRIPGARQPFHAAEEMPLPKAEAYIRRCVESSDRLALEGIRAVVADLEARSHRVRACGLLLSSGRPLGGLADTLASHAKIHTADGEHFRDALARAAESLGLALARAKEREIWETAAARARIPPADLQGRVSELKKTVGAPWTRDEKLATAVAVLALASLGRA